MNRRSPQYVRRGAIEERRAPELQEHVRAHLEARTVSARPLARVDRRHAPAAPSGLGHERGRHVTAAPAAPVPDRERDVLARIAHRQQLRLTKDFGVRPGEGVSIGTGTGKRHQIARGFDFRDHTIEERSPPTWSIRDRGRTKDVLPDWQHHAPPDGERASDVENDEIRTTRSRADDGVRNGIAKETFDVLPDAVRAAQRKSRDAGVWRIDSPSSEGDDHACSTYNS